MATTVDDTSAFGVGEYVGQVLSVGGQAEFLSIGLVGPCKEVVYPFSSGSPVKVSEQWSRFVWNGETWLAEAVGEERIIR